MMCTASHHLFVFLIVLLCTVYLCCLYSVHLRAVVSAFHLTSTFEHMSASTPATDRTFVRLMTATRNLRSRRTSSRTYSHTPRRSTNLTFHFTDFIFSYLIYPHLFLEHCYESSMIYWSLSGEQNGAEAPGIRITARIRSMATSPNVTILL